MRVVLHIGTEKTGTTAIQAHCHAHARALRAAGILYPAGLGYRNQVDLATAFAPFVRTGDMRGRDGIATRADLAAFRERTVARLTREVARRRPEVLLLSEEHLSSRYNGAAVTQLRDLLAGYAPEIRVIVYLRRQDAALVSLYSTSLKSQRPHDLAWLARTVPWLHYDRLLARWARVFGHERLDVRLYPPGSGTLIEDFSAAAGLPRLPEDRTPANRSLDRRHAALLARMNPALPLFRDGLANPDRAGLVEFLEARSTGSRIAMPRADREAVLARYAAGNETVRATWFTGRATLFDAPPDDAAPPAEASLEDAIELACAIWADRARLAARLKESRRPSVAGWAAHAVRRLRR